MLKGAWIAWIAGHWHEACTNANIFFNTIEWGKDLSMQFKGLRLKTKLGDSEVCEGVPYRNLKVIIRGPVMSTGGHFQKKVYCKQRHPQCENAPY